MTEPTKETEANEADPGDKSEIKESPSKSETNEYSPIKESPVKSENPDGVPVDTEENTQAATKAPTTPIESGFSAEPSIKKDVQSNPEDESQLKELTR